MLLNSTIIPARQRHPQRKAKLFLGLVCIIVFIVYTSTISIVQNSWFSITKYRQASSSGMDFLEYQQDEVAHLLSGPDNDIGTKKKSQSDIEAIEWSLNKILRLRRLMTPQENTVVDTECKANSLNVSKDVSTFPNDLFTSKQLKNGAVVLHMIGLVYMFIALAIVCDEFFVPSLDVMTEWLEISDDVAGATFMAAGGSAPEFFTSIFGVFITRNNVGIGTIVGSAIFNILCVLAFCALFSKRVLQLTWWSLFRDVSFYVIGLSFLGVFFRDEVIEWYEALGMFSIYVAYAIFMKYNKPIESCVKSCLQTKSKVLTVEKEPRQDILTLHKTENDQMASYHNGGHQKSISVLHGGTRCRADLAHMALDNKSLLEVLFYPTASADDHLQKESQHGSAVNVKDKQTVLVGPPKLKKRLSSASSGILNLKKEKAKVGGDMPPMVTSKQNCNELNFKRTISIIFGSRNRTRVSQSPGFGALSKPSNHTSLDCAISVTADTHAVEDRQESSPKSNNENKMYSIKNDDTQDSVIIEEIEKPVDMSWPKTFKKQCTYLTLLPITWPLYMTLPDVKKESHRKFAAITFCCSILWIAFYSYLMIWWANTIGVTVGIPPEIMALTILAAGTSIPDLITSIIVARRGLGDMAVSSSVGSNLFDICVGLPIPWLFYFGVQPIFGSKGVGVISVQSKGLVCSIGLLFSMLLVLVFSIMAAGWRMSKLFGFSMIMAYFGFCVVIVCFEVGTLTCPLRIVGGGC